MHNRIADEHGFENVGAGDAALARDAVDQRLHGPAHRDGQRLAAVRVHHHVGHAAHQILAEADLRVRGAGGCHRAAAGEVDQMAGDGGRTDVAGDAEQSIIAHRTHVEQQGRAAAILMHDGLHVEVRSSQDGLNARQQGDVANRRWQTMLGNQFCDQPVGVAKRLVHVGRIELHGI